MAVLTVPFTRRALKEVPKVPGIYRIILRHTGESYIGLARNLQARLGNHLSCLYLGYSSPKFQRAFDSWSAFGVVAEVLELCRYEHLRESEARWILKVRPSLNASVRCGVIVDRNRVPFKVTSRAESRPSVFTRHCAEHPRFLLALLS